MTRFPDPPSAVDAALRAHHADALARVSPRVRARLAQRRQHQLRPVFSEKEAREHKSPALKKSARNIRLADAVVFVVKYIDGRKAAVKTTGAGRHSEIPQRLRFHGAAQSQSHSGKPLFSASFV